VLFPGNLLQLSRKADAILLLSLISGRNPELLIGNHVIAAPYLRDLREKLISVGYILVGSGNKTSVEYISQTEAIPADKPDIVVATALAGEMRFNMIYLEAKRCIARPRNYPRSKKKCTYPYRRRRRLKNSRRYLRSLRLRRQSLSTWKQL
jgi:putative glycerol-1-phosphate prenyltransferase